MYKQKYLKYKQKYFDLYYDIYGGNNSIFEYDINKFDQEVIDDKKKILKFITFTHPDKYSGDTYNDVQREIVLEIFKITGNHIPDNRIKIFKKILQIITDNKNDHKASLDAIKAFDKTKQRELLDAGTPAPKSSPGAGVPASSTNAPGFESKTPTNPYSEFFGPSGPFESRESRESRYGFNFTPGTRSKSSSSPASGPSGPSESRESRYGFSSTPNRPPSRPYRPPSRPYGPSGTTFRPPSRTTSRSSSRPSGTTSGPTPGTRTTFENRPTSSPARPTSSPARSTSSPARPDKPAFRPTGRVPGTFGVFTPFNNSASDSDSDSRRNLRKLDDRLRSSSGFNRSKYDPDKDKWK